MLGDDRVDKIEMSKVSNKLSVQGKHRQAASTSSSGECEDKVLAYKAQWDEETEVCELRDKVEWYEGDDGSLSLQICSGMW